MGLSENSVPLHPTVNDHYPYSMAIIGGIPHFQTYSHDPGDVSEIQVLLMMIHGTDQGLGIEATLQLALLRGTCRV